MYFAVSLYLTFSFFILLFLILLADVAVFANFCYHLSDSLLFIFYLYLSRFYVAQLATQGKLLLWGAKVGLQLRI